MTQPQRVLGLVLSLRRGGNSEVLTRTALQAAAAAGAQTDILFFKDLTVKWCDGCLSCVFGGEGCHKDDHAVWLYELVAGYDGLVVAAPTYLLTPAAPVKALIDRAVALGARDGRRAVVRTATIAVAGLRGWEHLAAPVLNQLAMLLGGGRPVGSVTAYAAGPGEALLDDDLLQRVGELGRAVAGKGRVAPPPGVCPVCYLERGEEAVRKRACPLCGYDPGRPEAPTRFEAESLTRFVRDWIHPSRERFLARRNEVKAARRALDEDGRPRRLAPGVSRAQTTGKDGAAGSRHSGGPPRILGVVGSARKGGNSELLTRVALRAAAEKGAATDIVYLADLDPGFCDGCLACVYKGGGCSGAGDSTWLFETAAGYDGVVVAAPTYFLGPPAPLKALIDHGVMEFPRLAERRPKPAGVICAAGLPGWDYLAQTLTSQLAMLLGGRLVGSMTVYAPGPGEALLDEAAVRQAAEIGLAVLEGRALEAPSHVCPVCRLPYDAEPDPSPGGPPPGPCPFCLHDPAHPGSEHRFTLANLAHHLADWMIPSRERFLTLRDSIKQARAARLGHEPRRVRCPSKGGKEG